MYTHNGERWTLYCIYSNSSFQHSHTVKLKRNSALCAIWRHIARDDRSVIIIALIVLVVRCIFEITDAPSDDGIEEPTHIDKRTMRDTNCDLCGAVTSAKQSRTELPSLGHQLPLSWRRPLMTLPTMPRPHVPASFAQCYVKLRITTKLHITSQIFTFTSVTDGFFLKIFWVLENYWRSYHNPPSV